MAGNYYFDPRPFYGLSNLNLVPLDEFFNGRREITAPWMNRGMDIQKKQHTPHYSEHSYPAAGDRIMNLESRRPEAQQYIQREYKKPEVRDDTYADHHPQYEIPRHPMGRSDEYSMIDVRRPSQPMQHSSRLGLVRDHSDQWSSSNLPTNCQPQFQQTHRGQDQLRWVDEGDRNMEASMPRPMTKNNNHHNNNFMTNMSSKLQVSNGRTEDINWPEHQACRSLQGQASMDSSRPYRTAMKHVADKAQQRSLRRDESSDDDDEDDYSYGKKEVKWPDNTSNNNINKITNNSNSNHMRGSQDHHSQTTGYNQSGNKRFESNVEHFGAPREDSNRPNSNHFGGLMEENRSQGNTIGQQYGQHIGQRQNNTEDGTSSFPVQKGGHHKATQGQYTEVFSKGQLQQFHGGRAEESGAIHLLKKVGQEQLFPKQKHGIYSSQFVELKVPICCDNCERKVRSTLASMEGVEEVLCDQWARKVTIIGNVMPDTALKRVRRVKKASEFWQHLSKQF